MAYANYLYTQSIWPVVVAVILDQRPLPVALWSSELMRQALSKTDLSAEVRTARK